METHYTCATSIPEIEAYINGSKLIAFDYETAPKDPYRDEDKASLDPAKADIVGVSFSIKPGTGIYVPIRHRKGKNIPLNDIMGYLTKFLLSRDIIKVAHNIAFESAMSYAQGIVIQMPVYDTICASQMSQNGPYTFRKLQDSGLKKLAAEIIKEPIPTFSDVTGGQHFDELDAQDYETVRYGAADSDYALRLYYKFNAWFDKYLPKHRYIVEEIESPTAVYLGIMKCNGVPVDLALMEEKREEADKKMQEYADQIHMMIGDVDIGANCGTKAFKTYLYQTLGLPVLKTTETNREAADDAAMVLLQEWCNDHRPEIAPLFTLIQEYRKWGKIKSTYLDGYMKYVNSVTHNIHPDFYALSTDTGRFNCSRPNCQNMPRKTNDPIGIRNLIKAPEGHLILSCDFSQIELRIGSFYCRDSKMLDTYRTGGDIHAATTSVIFGCTYEEAQDKHREGYKEQRTIAKNVNFGTFYGLFPRGLQKTLKFKAGVEKTVDECEEIIDNLKAGYSELTVWQDTTKAEAARRMYTETWLGRRRYLPNIRSDDWGKRSFAERCSLNTPIQGTAADVLKLSLGRLITGLTERPWLIPILQIHDELTFIIPAEKLDEAVGFVKECMEAQPFPEFDLPLIAEASAGPTFGTLEELD